MGLPHRHFAREERRDPSLRQLFNRSEASTSKPWVRFHLDFAEPHKDNAFLVLVDVFSKYLNATYLYQASSSELVADLGVVFRLLGSPKIVVVDNGGLFHSSSFAKLCPDFDIVYLRCSPYAPQRNGLAGKMACTLKNSIEEVDSMSMEEAVSS